MNCNECGSTDDVVTITEYWSCGGRGVGDFVWRKIANGNLPLCPDCESEVFLLCDNCGAFVDLDCVHGMEEFNNSGEFLGLRCPECKQFLES